MHQGGRTDSHDGDVVQCAKIARARARAEAEERHVKIRQKTLMSPAMTLRHEAVSDMEILDTMATRVTAPRSEVEVRKIVGFLLCLVGHEHAQRHDELDPRIQERVAMQGL